MSAATMGLYTLSTAIVEVVWVVSEVLALSVFADERFRLPEAVRRSPDAIAPGGVTGAAIASTFCLPPSVARGLQAMEESDPCMT
jgi:hypothetical protein